MSWLYCRPLVVVESNMNKMLNRFSRQEIVRDFGKKGQEKLRQSKVLVVGAGGLGCPALQYLAAAGIGTLGVIDGDVVDSSNLNRQILFGFQDIGFNKAEQAVRKLEKLYDDIQFVAYTFYLEKDNIFELFEQYDLIVDGSDNFSTRYLVNDACVLLGLPLVFGAIYESEGQLAIFNLGKESIQYRDLHPTMPDSNQIPNCSETGVLGVLPGIIGCMQAAEAIKILSGYGHVLRNKVLFYSLKTANFYEIEIPILPNKLFPQSKQALLNTTYSISCGSVLEILWSDALKWLKKPESILWDIREHHEEPKMHLEKVELVPLSTMDLAQQIQPSIKNILLTCQSGVRSQKLCHLLQERHPRLNIFSITGGVLNAPQALLVQGERIT